METCPGAVAGQYGANIRTTALPGLALIDTQGVDISGLEIRNFCIGILIHRASSNVVHDNRIVGNRGGAGVMLTGDDGSGNPTASTTQHNKVLRNEFVDNGDGLELTRGAAFNLIANNVFRATADAQEPSQGIEILLGHDNVLVHNRFEGYSDGVQINGGNRNTIASNVLTNNTLGLSLSGIGNVIDGNTITGNAVGIAVRPASPSTVARITRNSISGNGQTIVRCWAGGSCDPNLQEGRDRLRRAERRACKLSRQAWHRREPRAREPGPDLPGRRTGLPGRAQQRAERPRHRERPPRRHPRDDTRPPAGRAARTLHHRGVRQRPPGDRGRGRAVPRRDHGDLRRQRSRRVRVDRRCGGGRRSARLHRDGNLGRRRDLGAQPRGGTVTVSAELEPS